MSKAWQIAAILAVGLVLVLAGLTSAEPPPGPAGDSEKSPAKADAGALVTQQQQVAQRFLDLEKLLLRMAELTAPTDPRRAALLRQAVAQSKQRDLDQQFEQLVDLLRQERLSLVVKNQGEVHQDLVKLLELLLSEDRSKHIESEKARVREYLKRVNRIIKEQKAVQGETSRDVDTRKLADRQAELADKTAELAGDIQQDENRKAAEASKGSSPGDDDQENKKPGDEKQEGEKQNDDKQADKPDSEQKPDTPDDEKSPDPKPPQKEDQKPDGEKKKSPPVPGDKGQKSQPGEKSEPGESGKESDKGQKPQDSQPREQDQKPPKSADQPPAEDSPAQKRLKQAEERMKEAQQKLEQAKREDATEKQAEAIKELEQAKADLEEILRQLREEETARTLAMLEARFRKMLDQQTEVYEGTRRLDKVPETDRDRDDEIEAGRLKVKEMQIAVEADKALTVLREEGTAVAFPEAVVEMRDDMGQVVDRLGQAKVGEVTQGLEKDIIAALEEMIASLQKAQKEMDSKSKPGQPPPDGDFEPPLVDTISELKMIRALQMRVNTRTQRYAEMTKTEQTEAPELLEALEHLAEREQRIHQVTRDIAIGRNR